MGGRGGGHSAAIWISTAKRGIEAVNAQYVGEDTRGKTAPITEPLLIPILGRNKGGR